MIYYESLGIKFIIIKNEAKFYFVFKIRLLFRFEGIRSVFREQVFKYKDKYFSLWHSMIKNIKEFADLSFNSVRQIWLCLKREKFYANTVVVRFGQVCDWCYFVEKGQLMVYVWNEMTKSATHFQKISSGGWCNFVNSITEHRSIFI